MGWLSLDVHFHVGSLVIGTFGGKAWMTHLRQTAGATSEAKAKAAKENGRKGGPPRKASAAS